VSGPGIRSLEDLFELCIPEPNTGCWLWSFGLANGYGSLRHPVTGRAHRLAAHLSGRDIVGVCVLHKCDTPACVNPEHLFLWSQADNNRDAARKCRQRSCNRGKAQCIRGHALTGENLKTQLREGGTRRTCRTCLRAAQLERVTRLIEVRKCVRCMGANERGTTLCVSCTAKATATRAARRERAGAA